jgi:hypothetical protein
MQGVSAEEIPRIEAPPREEFMRRWERPGRPVVVRGLTAGWRAPEDWRAERLAADYGTAQVVAAMLFDGTLLDDPESGVVFRRITLGDFAASLRRGGAATHYVMAPTWDFPREFQHDFRVPAYCAGAAHMRAKVWLGKAGTVTPLHRDVPHNLHVHLRGRKRWLLFPPRETSRLYSRGLFSGMPNFSAVDPEEPDYARYPRFCGARALGATLEAGETLFIPHGWWHHTRSLDDIVSMNFWYGGRLVWLASLASTAFKRLRGIRQDEWA